MKTLYIILPLWSAMVLPSHSEIYPPPTQELLQSEQRKQAENPKESKQHRGSGRRQK